MIKQKPEHELYLLDSEGNRQLTSNHKMNKKANGKLNEVTKFFADILPDYCEIESEQMLSKTLHFKNCEPLHTLYMLYDIENRFAAMSYNLLLQSFLETEEEKEYLFELKYDGIVAIKNARFICQSESIIASGSRARQILETLNTPLLLKKIMSLNLLQVMVKYFLQQKRWIVSVKSLVGSSTWILIPPVMHLIKPQTKEIFTMVEVMQMLLSALSAAV